MFVTNILSMSVSNIRLISVFICDKAFVPVDHKSIMMDMTLILITERSILNMALKTMALKTMVLKTMVLKVCVSLTDHGR